MIDAKGNKMQKNFKIELMVAFPILVSIGFPGNFTEIYGDSLGKVMEYSAFFVEILVMLFSSGDNWLDIRVVNLDKKYTFLYLFAAVTFIDSMLVTQSVSLQFITCTRFCVTLLFAVWIQEQIDFERLIKLICIAQVIFILFVLAFILMHPGEAFESGDTYQNALRGLYPTKNSFASELCFGILSTGFLIREEKRKNESFTLWMGFLIVQCVLLLMCQAMGAMFCMLFVVMVLILPKHIRIPLGWAYIGINVFFLFAMLTLMPYFEFIFNALGKDATLTGRIPLWNQIISVMLGHNTLTGYGYGMFWRDTEAVALIHAGFDKNSFLGTMNTGAHNVLLEFWVNSGLIGIAMLFLILLYSTRNIEELPENKYMYCTLFMAYLLINGLTERCLGGNYDFKTLFFFMILAICCNRETPNTRWKLARESSSYKNRNGVAEKL